MPGQRRQFSKEQNDKLRELLLAHLRAEHGGELPSQAEIGELLNMSQQTAGSFIRGSTNASLETAERIAKLVLGRADPYELFRQHGLLPQEKLGPDPYDNRRRASDLARKLGLPEEAIRLVRTMTGTGLQHFKESWWLTCIQEYAERMTAISRDVEAKQKKRRRKPSAA